MTLLDANQAKIQSEKNKRNNAENHKKWVEEEKARRDKWLENAREEAKQYLPEYFQNTRSKICEAIRLGKREAQYSTTYPKGPGKYLTDDGHQSVVLQLLVEKLIKLKYRAYYEVYHDNEGPDIYTVFCTW